MDISQTRARVLINLKSLNSSRELGTLAELGSWKRMLGDKEYLLALEIEGTLPDLLDEINNKCRFIEFIYKTGTWR